jgi:hypothetical protein
LGGDPSDEPPDYRGTADPILTGRLVHSTSNGSSTIPAQRGPEIHTAGAYGAMDRSPGWTKWPIGVLLSPVFAFLLALSVAIFLVVIKEAGLAGCLAALGTGSVTYLGVRRLRGPRVSDT